MSTSSRTVRVFLSSTFRDFAEERDLLVRKVFPELRRKCRERQVELVDVDLRWGITEEEAQQGKVLPICLAEIDRSRPFFMGFIGERYGWVPEPEKYDLSLIMEQPWLDEHRGGKSVTELEMLHGVLNNPAMEDRAFFYFRHPAWSQKKGGAYLSEGSLEKEKLEALKNRIRQSGYPVVEDYPTPEALTERVKEDLWKLIDEAYPASEVPDALAQERMRHEAFAASRLGLYIGGEKYFEALDAAMAEEPCKPILVCGASGGGKSALLANWAQRFSSAHPEAIVLTHFLGTGADAAHPVNMAIRLLREMARITGEEFVLEGDPRKALRLLGEWLEKAGASARARGGVFVLVLDALDKMAEHRDLDWWPSKLPEGVAIVASCLDGDVRDTIARRMEWTEVRVSPLEPMDCERFIEDHLVKYRKAVTPEQKDLILEHPLCGNPLFLRTLLEELRVFGVHEELNRRLQHYLASETIDDLFEKVLERIESDNTPESVRAALEVLWSAKESFAEDELLTVSLLPPAVWAPIHIALDESLIGAGGRIAFSHDYLRKAVEDRYLDSEEARQSIQKRMAGFCAQAMAGGRKEISRYVRHHAVEHFLEAEDWDNATAALSDLEFIEARAIAQELAEMLKDYAGAVNLLPEGEQERQTEAARQAELDRYAKDMADYSASWARIRNGSEEPEPQLPRPVPQVRMWTKEEIAAERKRITEVPNRLDIVKAFRVFVATNSGPLQKYASQEGFVANHARNDAPAGPVHEEGKRRLDPLKCIKLLKKFHPQEFYNPLPACQAILEGHKDFVRSVLLCSHGRRVISWSDDHTVRVWNTETGECLMVLKGHTGPIYSFVQTADERVGVSGSGDDTLRVWDMETGKCLKVLKGFMGAGDKYRYPNLRWKSDITLSFIRLVGSSIVAYSSDRTLRIWDVASGECLHVLEGHAGSVTSLVLSADGRKIVSGSDDKTLRVWDMETGECLKVLEGHTGWVKSLVLSADGRQVVSGSWDNIAHIWDVETGACLHVLTGHTDSVTSLALSADGRQVVSGSADKTLRVWNAESGECLRVIEGHTGPVSSVVISADGALIISGSRDQTLRIWNLKKAESFKKVETHTNMISTIALSTYGKYIVSGSWDQSLRIWDLQAGRCLKVLNEQADLVFITDISLDGTRIFSGGKANTLRVWDAKSGECLRVLEGHDGPVLSLLRSTDDRRVISGSLDNTLRIWDLESGVCLKVLEGHKGAVYSIILSADGKRIISGSRDQTLRIWDLESGVCLKVLEGHKDNVRSLLLSSDGRFLFSGGEDQTLRKWSIESRECIKVLEGHESSVSSLAQSTDGKICFSKSYNTVRLLDLKSHACLGAFFIRGCSAIALQSKDKKLVAGFSNGRLEIYSFENLSLGPFITTAHRQIISEDLPAGPVTARPACCGQLISISSTIANRIEYWALDGGDSGYTDPTLLLNCPHCQTLLRMNPFFVDVSSAGT